MTDVSASAPGKVVISGEYAVLDGAPAIAAAVSRRARVTIGRAPGSDHTVSSPDISGEGGKFRSRDGNVEWLNGRDLFGIVEHVWQTTAAAPAHAVAISIDTSEFLDRGSTKKLGLGSSAALTTALAAALYALAGEEGNVLETALAAHRRFQHGAGSGVDVACSTAGGVIMYCIDDERPQARQWPDGLLYALLWSGIPASTTAKLDVLARRAPMRSREELAAAAQRVAAAWIDSSAVEIIAAMHAYTDSLQTFSIDHDLGIFDAGHAGLIMPGDADVVYKPCGAGGGDVGIALATDEDALAAFVDRAMAANFVPLDLVIDPHGCQVAREDD